MLNSGLYRKITSTPNTSFKDVGVPYTQDRSAMISRVIERQRSLTTAEGPLAEAQLDSARAYGGSLYRPANARLRGLSHGFTDEALQSARLQDDIANIASATDDNILVNDVRLYRGMGDDYANQVWSNDVGSTFTDAGFSSTSMNRETAINFARGQSQGVSEPLVLDVLAPSGTRALPLVSNNAGIAAEQEMLLQRGTRFRILRKWSEDGLRRVEAEVISQGWERAALVAN